MENRQITLNYFARITKVHPKTKNNAYYNSALAELKKNLDCALVETPKHYRETLYTRFLQLKNTQYPQQKILPIHLSQQANGFYTVTIANVATLFLYPVKNTLPNYASN